LKGEIENENKFNKRKKIKKNRDQKFGFNDELKTSITFIKGKKLKIKRNNICKNWN
jgi:hypothetical protein